MNRVPPGVRHIVLLGLMGSGKTSVGRVLGTELGWVVSDSDEDILLRTGESVRQLEAERGVDAMHELEHEHLLAALREDRESIVCAAASVVDDGACRSALLGPGIVTVFLDASPAILARRFTSSAHRPTFGDDPEKFLADQFAMRGPAFRALSQIVIEEDELTVGEVAQAILSAL